MDLSFVQHKTHRAVIEDLLPSLRGDDEVKAAMVQGSVARGDAYPHSDLDLAVVLRDGVARNFESVERDGILVETHYFDQKGAERRIKDKLMLAYGFLDAKVLHDPERTLNSLRDYAASVLRDYVTSREEMRGTAYWLRCSHGKMVAALNAGDTFKASFVARTSTWELLRGLWAVNDKPIPPCGGVFLRLKDLTIQPDDFEESLRRLLTGDAATCVRAAVELIAWVLQQLEGKGT